MSRLEWRAAGHASWRLGDGVWLELGERDGVIALLRGEREAVQLSLVPLVELVQVLDWLASRSSLG